MGTIIRKLAMIGLVLVAAFVMGGNMAVAGDKFDTTMEVIKNQRKDYIEKSMELSPQEEEAFWALYDEYHAELSKIRERFFKLYADFVEKQGYLSDEEAMDMLFKYLKMDEEEGKLIYAYLLKFKKVLPGRKVMRFYQVETRFDSAAIAMLHQHVPLIR